MENCQLEPDCYDDSWEEYAAERYEEYLAQFDPDDEDSHRMSYNSFLDELAQDAEARWVDCYGDCD